MTLSVTLGSALWLGLLTSISPCPLATNLAATAWLSRRVESRGMASLGVLGYTIGRAAAYGGIAALLALGLATAPVVSQSLQRWLPPLLGPLIVITAMVLLGLIPLSFRTSATTQAGAERWASRGWPGGMMLGFLFALSFCPVSAALFFGGLVPLATKSGHVALSGVVFGIGTAAPVAACALLMVFSARGAARLAGGISRVQPWLLRGTGALLLAAGLYLTLRDTLGVLP